jgi:hypothetical protein
MLRVVLHPLHLAFRLPSTSAPEAFERPDFPVESRLLPSLGKKPSSKTPMKRIIVCVILSEPEKALHNEQEAPTLQQ